MRMDECLRADINRKIIRFFLENPSSVDTARGIATWINERPVKTKKALENLAKAKILTPHGSGSTSAYGCTTDFYIISGIKARLEKFE